MRKAEQRVLQALLEGPKSYWRLLRDSDLTGQNFSQLLGDLLGRGFIESRGEFFYLTDLGKEFSSGLSPLEDLSCPACHGKTVIANGQFSGLLEEFQRISQGRPRAVSDYDQGYILPSDTVSRALFLYSRGDLEDREIIFLGDDDLTSLACALTGLPRRIQVIEIDRRLNDFLREKARERGWKNYEVLDYDARKPLPEELHGKFDVFFTDPVETLPGITLFLSRCVQALKGNGASGYFGLTRIECSLEKWKSIQENLLKMNFAVTEIVRNFHEYFLDPREIAERGYRIATNAPVKVGKPDVNFFRSSLVRIEAVGEPKPLITEEVDWKRDLYYDEEMWVTLP
ncbi:MAG: bis-aminopropyl spermidine synthase family protein [Caldiserica bacterium]|jgi:predicted methyltransferase|nr:bis-aminopropyl spermidine synthase family protein [Caldisericota bacterium]MDH7562599.1 bis-aminopropyl spermidine synthase family protein [Caldisericota bacterium]